MLTKTGKLRSKSGAGVPRGSASKLQPTKKTAPQVSSAASVGPDMEAQIQASAMVSAQTFIVCGTIIGGEDFQPEKGEAEGLTSSFAAYYRAKGIVDIPPGAALVAVMGMYVLKRWNAPKVVERRRTIVEKVKEWYVAWRVKREVAKL